MFSKRLIYLLTVATLLVTTIPATGYFSALLIQRDIDKKFMEALVGSEQSVDSNVSLTELCSTRRDILRAAPKVEAVCLQLDQFNTLERWSLISVSIGLGYLLLILVLGVFVRNNRLLLALVFKPVLRFSQLLIGFFVIAHGGILIFAIYFSESYWSGRVHFVLLVGAGIVTCATAVKILGGLFSRFKTVETTVLGRSLSRQSAPGIWELVDKVAALAETSPPQNLLVGMSPNFFVTEAKVKSLDGIAKGRTLYLSLPFCRLLTPNELRAIIAHELAHFVGRDTRFSRHFYPIYRGAVSSLETLREQTRGEGGLHTLALLPSTFLMSYFLESFSIAEKEISRARELAADALAGKLIGNDAIATALIKVHGYGNIWPYAERKMLDAQSEGKQLVNAASFFELVASHLSSDFISSGLEESHTDHPTDSHPSLKVRLDALSFMLSTEMISKVVEKVAVNASSVIENVEALEKQLTEFEHEKVAHGGVVRVTGEDSSLRQILLRALILMMLIDGKVTDEEVLTLKTVFEKVTAERLSDAEIRLEISRAKEWAGTLFDHITQCEALLQPEAKEVLLKALVMLAVSDGDFHQEEKDLTIRISAALGLEAENLKRILDELFGNENKQK